jgi:ribonuclease BN (tRNA processing enzyme)
MAGRSGREAKSKHLALFHIPPPNDHREDEFLREATQEYGSEVTLATDLATIEI